MRSQSISTIRLQEKDNEQKSNKQHCGRTPHQQQHSSETQQEIPPPVIDEQITVETNENLKEVEVDLTSSHAPADKLSIKSGVSMAASSNSVRIDYNICMYYFTTGTIRIVVLGWLWTESLGWHKIAKASRMLNLLCASAGGQFSTSEVLPSSRL